jgi:hypothetical protein
MRVAAFPVAGPRDVIGRSAVGALDRDLRAACLQPLTLSRPACRAFALGMSWEASAQKFLTNAMASTRPVNQRYTKRRTSTWSMDTATRRAPNCCVGELSISGQEKGKTDQLTEDAASALAEFRAIKPFWK